ncbi:hypothetical protein ABER68_25760 [Paenibacillus alvei]
MTKIHITAEPFNSEEDYLLFEEARVLSKIYIGPSEYENYDEETKQFLYDFLCKQNEFSLFVVFEAYKDCTEELESKLRQKSIPYSLGYVEPKQKGYPVFRITINNSSALNLVLEESFWFAGSNQFYAVSFSDNITYKHKLTKGLFGRQKQSLVPCFNMKEAATVIVIWHDGQGFTIYTNDFRYTSLDELIAHLPSGTIKTNSGM